MLFTHALCAGTSKRAKRLLPAIGLATMVAASALSASMAHAGWLKAESRRFIVYSNGFERDLREAVTELENFDATLRIFMNVDQDAETYRKLPIYLLTNADMRVMVGSDSNRIAGFYLATDEDIFAVATRNDNFTTLKHEYAHHFMKSEFNFPYPAWYVEGFAEFYAPAEFTRRNIMVGKPNVGRAQALHFVRWMPISQLLSTRPFEVKERSESYYPLSWLMTHWFMARQEGRPQLIQYLKLIGEGEDPVEAMQGATGMTPAQITTALRRYLAGRINYALLPNNLPVPEITITPMPASADALLVLGQKLKSGSSEEERATVLQTVRTRAANYPDDSLALFTLGHAELHNAKDDVAAETAFTRLLDIDPDHIEALQFMARINLDRAEDPENVDDEGMLRSRAHSYLARAYAADDANYITFMLMSQNRVVAENYPNENDLETLALAYMLAPQISSIALSYASALISHDRHSEAVPIIQIVVNNPHMSENEGINELLRRARKISQEEWDAEKARASAQADEELAETGDAEPQSPSET